ncbi:MAG: YbhB/YbcL family Raf kinase inhibitor-like protein, partial [Candidatus Sericytochromatia bacterium]
MELTSAAFEPGGKVPSRYTCDGEDVSPPLAWRGVPAGAESLALIVDDPDAPGKVWVHWVLYGLPPETAGIEEGAVPTGAREGMTDFGRTGYG